MKTLIRFVLGTGAVAVTVWGILRAAEPPKTGKVLLLENERILEGNIEREGDRYRIRRSMGETWLPCDKAVRLCENMEEAYKYLRNRANLRDPDERLRLGRWCQLHGLREQGIAEATAALEMKPNCAEAERLIRSLKRAAATESTTPVEPGRLPEAELAPPQLSMDLTLEALGLFSTRVQPILMNKCASCHISGKGGSFKLVRAFDDGIQNRRSTQQNLAAVVNQIHIEHWQSSPLLTKAVSIHGDQGQAPLKGRGEVAYRLLEEWVQLAVANAPPPREIGTTFANNAAPLPRSEVVPASLSPEKDAASKVQWAVDAKEKPKASTDTPVVEGKDKPNAISDKDSKTSEVPTTKPATLDSKVVDEAKEIKPKETPKPAAALDPYDPAIFNRQMHPGRPPVE